jgi:hypothetical protein
MVASAVCLTLSYPTQLFFYQGQHDILWNASPIIHSQGPDRIRIVLTFFFVDMNWLESEKSMKERGIFMIDEKGRNLRRRGGGGGGGGEVVVERFSEGLFGQ